MNYLLVLFSAAAAALCLYGWQKMPTTVKVYNGLGALLNTILAINYLGQFHLFG